MADNMCYPDGATYLMAAKIRSYCPLRDHIPSSPANIFIS